MAQKIKVAIIGGSLSGCTLARGLLHHANVEFDLFESKAAFAERGQGVSLSLNGETALREMGLPVDEMFKNAGAVMGEKAPNCLIVCRR